MSSKGSKKRKSTEKLVGEECECSNKLLKVTKQETHCRPRGYFQQQYSCFNPVDALQWKLSWVLCVGLCESLRGLLLHVPWGSLSAAVLKRALSSRLTAFPPRSEGLTVLLGLNEEEFALPWQKISQRSLTVMAARHGSLLMRALQAPPPPASSCHQQPSPPRHPLLLLLTPSCEALEMPKSLLFLLTIKTTK